MRKVHLSVLIPLLLILSSLVSSGLLFWQEMRTANRSIQQAGIDNLHTTLTHLQNMLNTQLAADSLEDAKLSLSVSALHPGIRTLLLADENNTVMLANRYIWVKGRADQVSGYNDLIAQRVRQTQASSVSLNAGLLSGYYPVTLKIVAGGLGVNKVGVLFVEQDLASQLAHARHNAVVNAASFGGLMIAVAIAVAMLLHWLISRRVAKIVVASKRFAAGDLDARVYLSGHDELAELGHAFDDMASQRKEAQEALRQANVYNRSLIEASLDPLVTISTEGKITDVNQATEKVTGRSRSELIGTDFSSYFAESDKARAGYEEVFANGFVTDYPLALRHASGSVTEVLYNASVYRNEKGEVAGIFAAARDVTRVRHAEWLIRERMKELQAFYYLSELAARKDFPLDSLCQELANVLPGSWQYPETACARVVMGESEFRTANFGISEWMQAAPIKVLEAVVGKVEVGYLEQKPEADEGPFLKEERQLIEAIAERVGQIAELKRAEDALKQASAYTRSLIEVSLDPLVTISSEGKIMDVNQATERVTGFPRERLIGSDFSDYFTEPDKAREGYQQVFQKGSVTDYPLALRHSDGHVTEVLYNASVYRNESGEVLGVFAAARDITEHKRAEAMRTQLAAIVESSNDAIIGKTPDGIITSWNKGAEKIYGYTADEAIGKPITMLAPPSRHAEIHEILEKIRQGGSVANHESERIRKDGTLIQVALTLSPISDGSGHISGISTIARDITELKLAEEQLRRSEHGLTEAQRIAHLGSWELDLVNNVLTWSDEIYRIFEIDPEKFGASYDAFLNAIHPEDREMVNNAYTGSVKDKVPYDIVHRLQMQDGRIKYVNEKCETYYGEDGKPLRSVGTVHDITERKFDEEALQRLNRELRAISNCNETLMRAEDEHALLDDICRIVCDDAGYRMAWVGYPENDEAKTIRPVAWAGVESGYLEHAKLTWADTERGRGPSGAAIRSGESVSIQDFITDPNAAPWRAAALQRGYRSSIALPLKDESANTFGILNIYAAMPNAFTPDEIRLLEELAGDMAFGIAVLRARIERKQAEEEIRNLNLELERRVAERTAQLETANKELEAFSYSVSHDLRTPLRAVDGFSHILQEDYADKLDDEGKRLLNVVRDNANRMGQLIDDILKFSRASRLELSFSEIDMERLAREVSDELRSSVADAKLQLEIEAIPPATGDRAMMRQVFVNLLSNAIKFTHYRDIAKIKVGGSIEGDEAVYYVKDNGAGFDMQYADKLFGVFQRLHSVAEFEGTGIGLAIVKRIITRHGGRVWAEGKVNEGATICFALPRTDRQNESH